MAFSGVYVQPSICVRCFGTIGKHRAFLQGTISNMQKRIDHWDQPSAPATWLVSAKPMSPSRMDPRVIRSLRFEQLQGMAFRRCQPRVASHGLEDWFQSSFYRVPITQQWNGAEDPNCISIRCTKLRWSHALPAKYYRRISHSINVQEALIMKRLCCAAPLAE